MKHWLIILFTLSLSNAHAQLVLLLQKEDPLSLPFEYRGDLIVVNVLLEHQLPLKFILDTGAENCVLFDKAFTEFLGLEYDSSVSIRGSNLEDTLIANIVRRVNIQLENLDNTLTDLLVLEDPPAHLLSMIGQEIHGILGASFFSNFVLEVNSKKMEITFHTSTNWTKKKLKKFHVTPLNIDNGKVYVDSKVQMNGEPSTFQFLLDSGAAISLMIHHNTFTKIQLPEKRIRGIIGLGISGEMNGYLARVDHFKFGDIDFYNKITSFQTFENQNISDSGIIRNGIVGNQILRRFHWIIDYSQKKLYTRSYRKADQDFTFDKSGISFWATGLNFNEFQVYDLRPGSPAQNAGVQKGDTMIKLQGVKSHFYSLGAINKKLSKRDNKKIVMHLKRGNQVYRVKFRLKSLLL